MTFQTTAIYASLLAIIFVIFSFYVSAVRGKTGVGIGDGGNVKMLVAMRRHGNMAESTPFALLSMMLAEANGLSGLWIHVCGVCLVGGRLIHPFGIGESGGNFPARIVGQSGTYVAMIVPAIAVLYSATS